MAQSGNGNGPLFAREALVKILLALLTAALAVVSYLFVQTVALREEVIRNGMRLERYAWLDERLKNVEARLQEVERKIDRRLPSRGSYYYEENPWEVAPQREDAHKIPRWMIPLKREWL